MKKLEKYEDVERHLNHKQVYFKVEVLNADFKLLAESDKVHNVGRVEVVRLREDMISLEMYVNGERVSLFEHKTDKEFFEWVERNFIPVNELMRIWSEKNIG